MDISPMLCLPEEVREVIYSRLPDYKVMNLRLICQQFRQEIDAVYQCSVKYDERNRHVSRILELRVKSLEIIHFLEPSPRTYIFEQPNFIQILKIQRPEISPTNFFTLLKELGRQLTSLSIALTVPILRHEYEDPVTFHFCNLEYLSVSIDMHITTEDEKTVKSHLCQDVISFYKIVRDSLKPNLKYLKVAVGFEHREPLRAKGFSAGILATVGRLGKSLKVLKFHLMGWRSNKFSSDLLVVPSDLEPDDLALFKKVDSLVDITLDNSCSGLTLGIFEDLLQNQKRLKILNLKLLHLPWYVIETISMKSSETIISFTLTSTFAIPHKQQPIDLSVFKNCKSLKTLSITQSSSYRDPFDHLVFNLAKLPESIEILSFRCFGILTTEILNMSSTGFRRLKSLFLSDSGSSGIYGVTPTVLENLIILPKIRSVVLMELNPLDLEGQAKFNSIHELANGRRFCKCALSKLMFSRIYRLHGWQAWHVMGSSNCNCLYLRS